MSNRSGCYGPGTALANLIGETGVGATTEKIKSPKGEINK
jgi:hypothetical protein